MDQTTVSYFREAVRVQTDLQARMMRAYIRIEGMRACNQMEIHKGNPPAYDEGHFNSIINDEQIGYNQVIESHRSMVW